MTDQEEQRHAILCEGMGQHVWHSIAGAEVSVIKQTRGRISERLASKAKPYYLGVRLKVGRKTLTLAIVVRIHDPQPSLCGKALELES